MQGGKGKASEGRLRLSVRKQHRSVLVAHEYGGVGYCGSFNKVFGAMRYEPVAIICFTW